MKKFLMILATIIYVALVGNCAFAEEDFSPGGGFKAKRQEMRQNFKEQTKQKRKELKNRLNLSEEQKAKAKAIREEARPRIQPIVEKMKAKKQEIMELRQSGATKEEVKNKADELKSLREQANEIRSENVKKFEAILDPQQKTDFQSFKSEIKQKRKQMRTKFKEKRKNRLKHQHMQMD